MAQQMQKRQQKRQTLAELEAEYNSETLDAARGNKSEAARMLGISRKNLYEKLRKAGMREERRDEGEGNTEDRTQETE